MDSSSDKPRLREQVRAVMRVHHDSIRTEKSYWYWIRYFIRFHQLRYPLEMGRPRSMLFSAGWRSSARWRRPRRIWR